MSSVATMPSLAGAIDFSRKFIPEEFTALFHTPGYDVLSNQQRLYYNQLHGLYLNEQTMFFEKSFARTFLSALLTQDLPTALKAGVRQFIEEEERHSTMFQELNAKCMPEYYAHQDFHFIRVPAMGRKILAMMARNPKLFPVFLWLFHLQEERALFYGRGFLRYEEELEPHFVQVQRIHLADEVGHVRWDQTLIDWLWPRTPRFLRYLNARFLAWMIGEYFSAPKRAGLRLVDALVQKFPDLQIHRSRLREELLALEHNDAYRKSFYSSQNVPETLKRFAQWPEFKVMRRVMPAYRARLTS